MEADLLSVFMGPFMPIGQGGIRTLDRVTPIHAFQACAFSRSATCPDALYAALGMMAGSDARSIPHLSHKTAVPLRSQTGVAGARTGHGQIVEDPRRQATVHRHAVITGKGAIPVAGPEAPPRLA